MAEGWHDPDLPDGVVRFPPEPRPARSGRAVARAAAAAAVVAGAAWLVYLARLP